MLDFYSIKTPNGNRRIKTQKRKRDESLVKKLLKNRRTDLLYLFLIVTVGEPAGRTKSERRSIEATQV